MPHVYPLNRYGIWTDVKRKPRRSVESIILRSGVLDSILQDVREFVESEAWYNKAGIPHRMGFLLYGPPGTGKSASMSFLYATRFLLARLASTIYALAGEMGFEIYSLSLAACFGPMLLSQLKLLFTACCMRFMNSAPQHDFPISIPCFHSSPFHSYMRL